MPSPSIEKTQLQGHIVNLPSKMSGFSSKKMHCELEYHIVFL